MARQDIGEARASDLLDSLREDCGSIEEVCGYIMKYADSSKIRELLEMIIGKFEQLDEQISRGWALPSQWK